MDVSTVNMDEKIIYAHGKRDTIDGKPTVTNPTFTEGAANPYTTLFRSGGSCLSDYFLFPPE